MNFNQTEVLSNFLVYLQSDSVINFLEIMTSSCVSNLLPSSIHLQAPSNNYKSGPMKNKDLKIGILKKTQSTIFVYKLDRYNLNKLFLPQTEAKLLPLS